MLRTDGNSQCASRPERFSIRWLALALSCVLAGSCATPVPTPETGPIVIGMYADLSSTGARDGNDALKGALLRVKEINAAGGINGRAVILKYRDMKQNPTEAVKAYTALAQDEGSCAIIGASAANAGLAVSPVADLAKVPLISLSIDDRVTTPEWKPQSADATGLLRQYTFLVQPSAAQIAASMAFYAAEHFSLRRYATLYDPSSAVSVIQAGAFEAAVRKAGKIVAISQELPQQAADYAAPLAAIRDAAAEAVYVCGTMEENAAVARQARDMSFLPAILGNQAWNAPLLDTTGSAANGTWFSMALSPDDPGLAELSARFSAEFGEMPRLATVPGWDAMGLIAAAVRRAGSSNPQKVRDAIEQTAAFKGLSAPIDMDKKTHRPLVMPVAIMKITGGLYQTVEMRFTPKRLP